MTLAVAFSGSQTATVGVEHTLATTVIAGTYVLVANLSNLAGGDTVEIRIKGKIFSGDGYTTELLDTYTGAQAEGQAYARSIPVVSDTLIVVTIKQTAGVGRVFDWKLLSL